MIKLDSPYRTHVSQAVLKLQEDGVLRELKEKWWVEMNPSEGECGDEGGGGGDTPELGMDNVFNILFFFS